MMPFLTSTSKNTTLSTRGIKIMSVKYPTSFAVGFAIPFMFIPAALGHFREVDLQTVPIDRLITNLEEVVKKAPKNVEAIVNLARSHGMAYAWKTKTAELWKAEKEWGPWFGYTPKAVPFSAVVKTDDPVKQKAARVHLAKAINCFREAVNLAPDNMTARLGYAWTLEQMDHKKEAITQYRALIDEAWKNEELEDSLPLNGETIVTEAASYFIPLLDKEKDMREIATLADRVARLRRKPRPITPIAVPLRDGLAALDLEDRNAVVEFDADGSGLKGPWTWVTNYAGWLVFDPSGTGDITSSLQLFGNVTFWLFWENG
jgi:tetratricopeptide (TPR) repeat protein